MPEPPEAQRDTDHPSFEGDPRWQLVLRVVSSSKMRRAQRLQELLMFVAANTLRGDGKTIREQDIGCGVFGRPPVYDTSSDTIARVHTFQLRKRLKEYFESEGADEPVIIEIPKGAYEPEFVPRAALAPANGTQTSAAAAANGTGPATAAESPTAGATAETAVPAPPAAARRRFDWRIPVAVAALLFLGAAAGWQLRSLQAPAGGGVADDLWRQMFSNGRPTELAVADASVSLFQSMLGRNITLAEYQFRQWPRLALTIPDPSRRELAQNTMTHHQFTTLTEVQAVRIFGFAAARNSLPLDVVFARDLPARHLEGRNVILHGNRRANPWLTFFENRLNFQYDFSDVENSGFFRNAHPQPGEDSVYRVVWNNTGYCRLAYVPNLSRNGTVLIVEGTDLVSPEAGARFLTSDEWVARLRKRLSVRPGARLPYFEALLKTGLAVAAAPQFELAAARVYTP